MEKGIELVRPGQAEVTADLGALFRCAIRMVLEYSLNEEVSELIGAERYQRIASRSDYRNGSYLRRLATALGWIEVEVPRPSYSQKLWIAEIQESGVPFR
jgi:transposase-like protein